LDLVTLVTACALSIDAKVMHALIWQQSGGAPWSFSVPGEAHPRVYSTMREALREARTLLPDDRAIRTGLTGLTASPRSVTAALFVPCVNITMAARQIAQLGERCRTVPRFKTGLIDCAIAVYRGSWEQPDTSFAQAVKASIAKADAPNFDLPKDAYFDPADSASETPVADPHVTFAGSVGDRDDRQCGWSSALFPAKPPQPKQAPIDAFADTLSADRSQPSDVSGTRPPPDGLFAPRSPVPK
jgi:hypothetical protein